MSESDLHANDPLCSTEMAQEVSTMPDYVKQPYEYYMQVLEDDGTPGYDDRLSKARHDAANVINEERLKRLLATQENQYEKGSETSP